MKRVRRGVEIGLDDLRRPRGGGKRYESSAPGGHRVADELECRGLARAGGADAADNEPVGAGERLRKPTLTGIQFMALEAVGDLREPVPGESGDHHGARRVQDPVLSGQNLPRGVQDRLAAPVDARAVGPQERGERPVQVRRCDAQRTMRQHALSDPLGEPVGRHAAAPGEPYDVASRLGQYVPLAPHRPLLGHHGKDILSSLHQVDLGTTVTRCGSVGLRRTQQRINPFLANRGDSLPAPRRTQLGQRPPLGLGRPGLQCRLLDERHPGRSPRLLAMLLAVSP